MDPRTFPTKGNLMLAKNSLTLAKQGYDLMDKKRNIPVSYTHLDVYKRQVFRCFVWNIMKCSADFIAVRDVSSIHIRRPLRRKRKKEAGRHWYLAARAA